MREQIDFLILAPLPIEIEALVKSIKTTGGVSNKTSPTPGCHSFTLGEWSIVVIQLKGQGCLQSSIQTMNLLDEFDPEFTVSFGISGTLQDDVKLGDVVIGSSVYYYEPAKETTAVKASSVRGQSGNISPSRAKKSTKSIILSQHYAYACYEPRSQHTSGSFTVYDKQLIASGEKLIADINGKSRELILSIQRKMACVEMEAAGVAAAIKNHFQHYERNKFVSVKGISDGADKDKNSGESEENIEEIRQRRAAENAATILIALIQKMTHKDQTYQKKQPRIASVKLFAETFNKWLNRFHNEICECKIDFDLLKRAAFYADLSRHRIYERKVPIYYHWKQLNNSGLHLVDYLQLVLLHNLSKSSYVDPIALITNDEFTPDQLGVISSQVKKIIGSEPIFSSEIHKQNADYTTYCANNGYDGSEPETILGLTHALEEKGKFSLLRLLPYVAYNSRHLGACIVLCWHEHRKIYDELLMKILPLQPIILEVGTIKVGNEPAKFGTCGKKLIINPSNNYRELSEWVEKQPEENKNKVVQYINCLLDDAPQTEIDEELLTLVKLLKNEHV